MNNQLATLNDHEKSALQELKARLDTLLGPRVKETLIYGSKARGDSVEGSDIDVMVVIKNLPNPRAVRNEILHWTTPIDLKHDVFLSVFTVDAEYFEKVQYVPFYVNVRREGIPI
jgi:predicted nucleotidyltransferase